MPAELDFLTGTATQAAKRLLGCELIRTLPGGQKVRVKIVETESYDQTDPASHTYNGPTQRNQVMFGPAGFLYVYFTYGMHYCANISAGQAGFGAGVLLRAVEPLEGQDEVEQIRGIAGVNATNGPGKLTKALQIDFDLRGHNLQLEPLELIVRPELDQSQIVTTTRIGISKAAEDLRRFYIAGNKYVSKK